MKVSRKWRRAAEVYRLFVEHPDDYDFSEKAALELFLFESRGEGSVSERNGYAAGKKWMDVTVKMWLQDMGGDQPILRASELYEEGKFPRWWLDKLFHGAA